MEGRIGGMVGRIAPKVLLFSADDALLSLHLEWVEAVYARGTVDVHSVKTTRGPRSFVLHRGEPAFLIEPRALFGLPGSGEAADRTAYLVVRSASFLLALGVDECVGVQEFDLQTQVPIPTALTGDGGTAIGHLLDAEGRIVVVLDPNRLIDCAGRELVAEAAREAAAFRKREQQLDALWEQIRTAPTPSDVRKYGRLCRRNGRPKTAKAVRQILKGMADPEHDVAAGNGGGEPRAEDSIVAELICLSQLGESGALRVEDADGAPFGTVWLTGGRIVDAVSERSAGVAALGELLGPHEVRFRFDETAPPPSARIDKSSVAALIEAEALRHGEARGGRSG